MLGAGTLRADEAGWAALARPGAIAVMRHAIAPGTGDPPEFRLGDCATQRNLDALGRAQAKRIGAEMRARGVTFDRVLTSEWCRARETAELLDVGPVEVLPALNSFFGDRGMREARTREAYTFLRGQAQGQRVLLVTHQVNATALTGAFLGSGALVVGLLGARGDRGAGGDRTLRIRASHDVTLTKILFLNNILDVTWIQVESRHPMRPYFEEAVLQEDPGPGGEQGVSDPLRSGSAITL